jgi:MFS family permease
MVPWTATLFVFAPLGGRLVSRLGERTLVMGGLLLQAAGMAWIAMIAAPDVPYIRLMVPMILAGAGVSMAMPAAQNAVLSSVSAVEVGKASGAFNMFRFLGGAFGIALLAAVFDRAGSISSPAAFSSGFASAIGVAAVLSAAGAIAGVGVPGRRKASLAAAQAKT